MTTTVSAAAAPRLAGPPAAAVCIRRVNPLEHPDWDAVLARFPDASFFHGVAWARVLHAAYAFSPLYLVHETEGQIDGVLPLMQVSSWLTGQRGVSLPFTDACDVLGANAEVVAVLVTAATDLAEARGWKYCELRGGFRGLGLAASVAFHGHTLDLTVSASDLFERCDSATRRAIRKAQRASLTITFSEELEAVRTFHRLLCVTRRRHGLPPQPFRFFAAIHRHILQRQRGCVVLAHVEGRAVAGAVFFRFGQTAVFKYGASDEAFQHLRPNNLVMWEAIEHFARNGCATLDLGRSSLANEGLRHFKLGWGAIERRIEYARYDCRGRRFVSTPDRASGWHSRLFRYVPAGIARLIGAAVYKHAA